MILDSGLLFWATLYIYETAWLWTVFVWRLSDCCIVELTNWLSIINREQRLMSPPSLDEVP